MTCLLYYTLTSPATHVAVCFRVVVNHCRVIQPSRRFQFRHNIHKISDAQHPQGSLANVFWYSLAIVLQKVHRPYCLTIEKDSHHVRVGTSFLFHSDQFKHKRRSVRGPEPPFTFQFISKKLGTDSIEQRQDGYIVTAIYNKGSFLKYTESRCGLYLFCNFAKRRSRNGGKERWALIPLTEEKRRYCVSFIMVTDI